MRSIAAEAAFGPGPLARATPRPGTPSSTPVLPLQWLEAGPVTRWLPIYTRLRRKTEPRDPRYRIVLTDVIDPPSSVAAQRWLAAQQVLAPETTSIPAPIEQSEGSLQKPVRPAVFWRIAINRGVCALGATPAPSVEAALDAARSVVARVHQLTVVLAFSEGQPRPHWALRDGETTVLVGLPDFYLAATADPDHSLGSILTSAQFQDYIHHTEGIALA